MHERIAYLSERKYLRNANDYLDCFKNITDKSQEMINLSLKYNMKPSNETINRLITNMEKIILLEENTLKDMQWDIASRVENNKMHYLDKTDPRNIRITEINIDGKFNEETTTQIKIVFDKPVDLVKEEITLRNDTGVVSIKKIMGTGNKYTLRLSSVDSGGWGTIVSSAGFMDGRNTKAACFARTLMFTTKPKTAWQAAVYIIGQIHLRVFSTI